MPQIRWPRNQGDCVESVPNPPWEVQLFRLPNDNQGNDLLALPRSEICIGWQRASGKIQPSARATIGDTIVAILDEVGRIYCNLG